MDPSAAIRTAPAETTPQPKENLRERVQSLRLPDDHVLYGSRKRWLPWLVLLAAIAAGGWAAYHFLIVGDTAATTGSKVATSMGANPSAAIPTTNASSATGM